MIRPVTQCDDLVPIRTAVISVFDKDHLDTLVRGLCACNPQIKIYSSGGTAKHIRSLLGDLAEKVLFDVSSYTGMPETEGGLVKTLHHKLFLGYLTETYCEAHQEDLRRENAVPIDLVACNLYPFEEVVSMAGATLEDARGHIDVGGPSMVRAAAKNFLRVTTVVDPGDYEGLLLELKAHQGCLGLTTRFKLSAKAFDLLARYNRAIADYLAGIQDPVRQVRALYQIQNSC